MQFFNITITITYLLFIVWLPLQKLFAPFRLADMKSKKTKDKNVKWELANNAYCTYKLHSIILCLDDEAAILSLPQWTTITHRHWCKGQRVFFPPAIVWPFFEHPPTQLKAFRVLYLNTPCFSQCNTKTVHGWYKSHEKCEFTWIHLKSSDKEKCQGWSHESIFHSTMLDN